MSRRGTNNTSNYGERSGSPVTAVPFTVFVKFWPVATNDDYNFWSACISTGTSSYFSLLTNNGTPGTVSATTAGGGAEVSAITTATVVAGQWNIAIGRWTSATLRDVWCNTAASKGTNATSKTPAGIDRMNLGMFHDSGGSFSPLDGMQDETVLWNAALLEGNVARLLAGADPLSVQPESIVGRWCASDYDPILGTIIDSNPYRPRKYDVPVVGTLNIDRDSGRASYQCEPKRRMWRVGTAGAASPQGWQAVYPDTTGTPLKLIAF